MTTTAKQQIIESRVKNDPTFKGAFARSLRMVLYENKISPKSSQKKICKEVFMILPVVIYTRKNFFLLHSLNRKLEFLKQAGLIDHWQIRYANEEALNYKEQRYPRVLELHHLQGCFHVLLFGCFVSFIFFMLEIIVHRNSLDIYFGN